MSTEPPLDVARGDQQDEEVLATTQLQVRDPAASRSVDHGFTFFEVDTYDD